MNANRLLTAAKLANRRVWKRRTSGPSTSAWGPPSSPRDDDILERATAPAGNLERAADVLIAAARDNQAGDDTSAVLFRYLAG